tara:strand:- start:8441 stop:14704 length:6264 start_codon:yes stop_codon:yes gene_type:complete
MAKIKNTTAYPTVTPAANDLIIGTDVNDNNKTVTFTIASVSGGAPVNQDLDSVLSVGRISNYNIELNGNALNNPQGSSITCIDIFPTTISAGGLGQVGTNGQVLSSTGTGLQWIAAPGSSLTWQDTLNNGNTATSDPSLTGIFTITDGGTAGTSGLILDRTTYLNVDGLSQFFNTVTLSDGVDLRFSLAGQIGIEDSLGVYQTGTAGQFLSVNTAGTGMEWSSAPSLQTPTISQVLAAGSDTLGESMEFTGGVSGATLSFDATSNITSAGTNTWSGNNTFSANGTTSSTAGLAITGSIYDGTGTGVSGQVLSSFTDPTTGNVGIKWITSSAQPTLQSVLNNGFVAISTGVNIASISLSGNGTSTATATNGVFTIEDGKIFLDGDTEISLSGDVGTAGYALVSGGPNTLPSWANISGGGSGTVTSVTGFTIPSTNINNYVAVSTSMASPTPVITTNLITSGTVTGGLDSDFYNATGAFSAPLGTDWDFDVSKLLTVVTVKLEDDQATPRTTSFTLTEGTGIGLTQSGNDITVAYTGSSGLTSLGLTSSTLDLTQTSPNTNPATANGSIDVNLASSGVTAGTYNYATIVVDDYGIITSASSGTDTNTTYDLGSAQATNDVDITLTGSDATTDTIKLVAGTNITLTDNGSNQVTVDAASAAGLTSFGIATSPASAAGTIDVTNNTITFTEQVNTINAVNYNYIGLDISGTNVLTAGLTAPTSSLDGTTVLTSFLRADNTWAVPLNTQYSVFTGASSGVDGTTGLVPQPIGNGGTDYDKFLKGDGTWATPAGAGTVTNIATTLPVTGGAITSSGTIGVNTYTGATSLADGLTGVVPAALIAQRGYYLRGDGTWQVNDSYTSWTLNGDAGTSNVSIGSGASVNFVGGAGINTTAASAVPNTLTIDLVDYVGATSVLAGTKGGVPQPAAGDEGKFLRGSGGWENITAVTSVGLGYNTTGGTAVDGSAAFVVSGSPVSSSGTLSLTADGTSAQYITGEGKLATLPTAGTGTVTDVTGGTQDGVTLTITNSTTTPELTIVNTDKGSDQNIFKQVSVAGSNTIVADNNNDVINITQGNEFNLTSDATTDTIDFKLNYNTNANNFVMTAPDALPSGFSNEGYMLLTDTGSNKDVQRITLNTVALSVLTGSFIQVTDNTTTAVVKVGKDLPTYLGDVQESTIKFVDSAGIDVTVTAPVSPSIDPTINFGLSAFGGATSLLAGSIGAVPAPLAGDQQKYLRGDGTWTVNESYGYWNMSGDAGTSNQGVPDQREVLFTGGTGISTNTGSVQIPNKLIIDLDVFTAPNVPGNVDGLKGGVPAPLVADDGKFLSTAGWTTISATGTVTSVGASHGGSAFNVTGSPVTSSGTLAITMQGDNTQIIDGEGDLLSISSLPFTNNAGTVTSVDVSYNTTGGSASAGSAAFAVTGGAITGSGTIALTSTGTISQYIDGTGKLVAFPTISVPNNGELTINTGTGIGGGPVTFGANQGTNATLSLTNTGVTSLTGGTGITVSASTGAVEITADNNGTVTQVSLTGNTGTGSAITSSGTFDIDGITTASAGSTTNHYNGINTAASNFDLDIKGFAIPDENEYWFYRANDQTGTPAMGLQKSIVYGYDDAYKSLAVANGEVGKEGYTLVLGASKSSRAYIYNAGNTTYRWSDSDAAGLSDSSTNSIFIGASAGNAAASNSDNIGIGTNALLASTNGASNIALGTDAGKAILAGARNILIGKSAGKAIAATNDNVGIGDEALQTANVTANNNVAMGTRALQALTVGADNVAIGYQALADGVSVQTKNTFIGYQAGLEAFGGADVGMGYHALFYGSNTTPSAGTDEETARVAIGLSAMKGGSSAAVQGIGNVAIGGHAGEFNSTSILGGSVYVGHYAGNNANATNVNGNGQVAIGKNAMKFNTPSLSVAIGFQAMEDAASPTIGGDNHIAIGRNAMRNAGVTGNNNIAIGRQALESTTNVVSDVIAIGYQSNAKGSCTIAIGCQAAAGTDASSTDSIAIGNDSSATGTKSISIGRNSSTTGTHSIALGDNTQVIDNYSVAIGAGASTNAANQIAFGTAIQNLGAITTQTVTVDKTWTVRINGVNYFIPVVAVP